MPLVGLLLNSPIIIAATIASTISAAAVPPIARPSGLWSQARSVVADNCLIGALAEGAAMTTCGPDVAWLAAAPDLMPGIPPLVALPLEATTG